MLELALVWRSVAKKKGSKVAFTNGCFDLFHAGHLYLLEQAKDLADLLIVGINSDESVRRLKGEGRPIIPCEQREAIIFCLGCVDLTVVFDDDTPENLIYQLRPDYLVKGKDWEGKKVVGSEYVGEVVFVDLLPDISTTAIIERIRNG